MGGERLSLNVGLGAAPTAIDDDDDGDQGIRMQCGCGGTSGLRTWFEGA